MEHDALVFNDLVLRKWLENLKTQCEGRAPNPHKVGPGKPIVYKWDV